MVENNVWLPTDKHIEEYELLKGMLHSQKKEFDLLSKKKADEQLNPMKIKIVNRVLEPLKKLFEHEESHRFLDTLNENEMPTNSDVVLIISQYETAIKEFKGRYYLKDEYRFPRIFRWMTEEYPPEYFANGANSEDYYAERVDE